MTKIDTYLWRDTECVFCHKKSGYVWTDFTESICVCGKCFGDVPKHIPHEQVDKYLKRKLK